MLPKCLKTSYCSCVFQSVLRKVLNEVLLPSLNSAHLILLSALGPNPSFFLFGGTYIQLGGLLDPVGPGLDNIIYLIDKEDVFINMTYFIFTWLSSRI